MQNFGLTHLHSAFCILHSYNPAMSEVPAEGKPTRRIRLLWTLLGAMIVVGLVPLVVSHYFLIGINRESLETLERKYLTRSAVSIANEIQNVLTNNTQQLTKIAGSVRALRKALGGGDPFLYVAQTGVITDYITPDSDLLGLRILNRAGQGATALPKELDPAIAREMDIAKNAAAQGQTFTGTFQILSSVNQPAVIIAVPVVDGDEVIGTVEALVSLRRIAESIREEGKGDVTAFLVDNNGRVLIHSEPAVNVQRPDFSYLKIVQEFTKARVRPRLTESYVDTLNGSKVMMLGTVAPVGRPDWGVVVQKPESRAYASVSKMVRATITWVSVALGVAIIAAIVFASGIARPIRLLAERTREIATGNYQQRVELKTHNEIGELAENFNSMSAEIERAIDQLKKAAHENNLLFINSVRMLAAAIDAKDPYTRGHSERVARYSIGIGRNLALPDKEMRNLRISALLHDVGKIGIDDRILRKPGALSDDEFEVMKGHPAKGAAIMSGVAQLIDIIPGMKYHHEKWSGGGYPDGLIGEQIPVQARIVAIADTFDAMTTNRPYQKAMELAYVVEKIKRRDAFRPARGGGLRQRRAARRREHRRTSARRRLVALPPHPPRPSARDARLPRRDLSRFRGRERGGDHRAAVRRGRSRPPRHRRLPGHLPLAAQAALRHAGRRRSAPLQGGFREDERAELRPKGGLLPGAGGRRQRKRGDRLAAVGEVPGENRGGAVSRMSSALMAIE
jgi:HAMP domain-containing protein